MVSSGSPGVVRRLTALSLYSPLTNLCPGRPPPARLDPSLLASSRRLLCSSVVPLGRSPSSTELHAGQLAVLWCDAELCCVVSCSALTCSFLAKGSLVQHWALCPPHLRFSSLGTRAHRALSSLDTFLHLLSRFRISLIGFSSSSFISLPLREQQLHSEAGEPGRSCARWEDAPQGSRLRAVPLGSSSRKGNRSQGGGSPGAAGHGPGSVCPGVCSCTRPSEGWGAAKGA